MQVQQGEQKRVGAAPQPSSPSRRGRWLVPALALAVVGGGVLAYLHLPSPTPVSAAQATLDRAATAARATRSDQAIHATYAITSTGMSVAAPATLDEWVRRDASGGIAQAALTFSDATGQVQGRTILTGAAAVTYEAASNSIVSGTVDRAGTPNPLDTAALAQLAQGGAAGPGQSAQARPARMVDGVPVNVVEIDRALPTGTATTQPHEIVLTLAIDAHTSVVREAIQQTLDGTGATLTATGMRLTQYAVAPLSSLGADTFTLNAPPTAHALTAPDGSTHLGTEHPDVASIVALTDRPSLLLAHDAAGLQLHNLMYTRTPSDTIASYSYESDTGVLGVNLITGVGGVVGPADHFMAQPATPAQVLTLTIAGRPVQASYYDPAAESQALFYTQNGAGVRIVGLGLSKADFLSAVAALVDGRSDPTLVTQVQHELDAHKATPTPTP